jgi:hypothetical protein
MTRKPVWGLLGRFFVEELSSDGKIADKLNENLNVISYFTTGRPV